MSLLARKPVRIGRAQREAAALLSGAQAEAEKTRREEAEQARAESFSPVAARIEALSRPAYYGGRKTTVELVADRHTRRLLGGSVIGEEGAAGRINVIAAGLHAHLRVEDFEQLDLAYSPPFTPSWDPLLIAAQQLMKQV